MCRHRLHIHLACLLDHCRTEQTAVSRAQSDTQRGRRGIAGTGYTYTCLPPLSSDCARLTAV